jgi:hypothetical protein
MAKHVKARVVGRATPPDGLNVGSDGTRRWYRDGLLHREGGPAVEEETGRHEWWLNGQRARHDDGPTVIRDDGTQLWLTTADEVHRDGGPAVIRPDGSTQWFCHGKEHRLDGPSHDFGDGVHVAYYVNDVYVTDDGNLLRFLDTSTLTAVLSTFTPGDDIEQLIAAVQAATTT